MTKVITTIPFTISIPETLITQSSRFVMVGMFCGFSVAIFLEHIIMGYTTIIKEWVRQVVLFTYRFRLFRFGLPYWLHGLFVDAFGVCALHLLAMLLLSFFNSC
ncbi:hypothetical protein CF111_16040 [Aeromonas sobria]|nr:hypothetical protein CF111_16040 [Aeromonas sobria]